MIDFPTGKPHVSFSEVKTWKECGWRHKLVHIDKLPDSPSIHTDFGKIVHDQCESYLKTRQMDVDGASKAVYDCVSSKWKDENPTVWSDYARNILIDIPAFLESEFPGWEFMGAELELYEPITGSSMKFKGFIDGVITCKGKRGEDLIWVIDWKTAGPGGWHPEKKRDVLVQMQLALYKIFLSEKLGLNKKNVRCAFLLLKRGAKPGKTCESFPVSVGPVAEARALKSVTDMVGTVAKRMFLKNRLSCKFCQFRDTQHCTTV
jgi:hypothetical protein